MTKQSPKTTSAIEAVRSPAPMLPAARLRSTAAVLSDGPVQGHRAEEQGEVRERGEVEAQRGAPRPRAQQADGERHEAATDERRGQVQRAEEPGCDRDQRERDQDQRVGDDLAAVAASPLTTGSIGTPVRA